MTILCSASPRALATPFLAASFFVLAGAVAAPAQSVTYTTRTGMNVVYCGPLGAGPSINHTFLTTSATNDSIAVSDPGAGSAPASAASAQFDTVATEAGISLSVAGMATRGGPPAAISAVADGRDNWQFTLSAPMRFTFHASLSASSTEATVPPSHFTFAGSGIVPDPGSPAPPYQQTLNAPGSVAVTASGTLLPGGYGITFFGRAEGSSFPYTGSYSNTLTITFQPAATATTRPASGNPNSYSCDLPILGQTWHANVDVGLTGHAFAIVFAALSPAQLPIGPGFTVLLGGPVSEFLPITPGPQAAYTLLLPGNSSLAGFQLSTQALHFGGLPSLMLSNAQDLTLGF